MRLHGVRQRVNHMHVATPCANKQHTTHPHTPLRGVLGVGAGPPGGPPLFWGPWGEACSERQALACRRAGAVRSRLGLLQATTKQRGLQQAPFQPGFARDGGWNPGWWRRLLWLGAALRLGLQLQLGHALAASAAVQRCWPVKHCTGRAGLLLTATGQARLSLCTGDACHGVGRAAGGGGRCRALRLQVSVLCAAGC